MRVNVFTQKHIYIYIYIQVSRYLCKKRDTHTYFIHVCIYMNIYTYIYIDT